MAPLAGVMDSSTSMGGLIPVVTPGEQATVKCVLVGDGAVGKTSLLASYATRECPTNYTPTAFDNYAVVVTVDDHPIRLHLRDTAGQLELDSLRTLCYADADVFLLCFNVACVESFDAITSRWLPEIRRFCPSTPVILIGTQSDRRLCSVVNEKSKKTSKSLVSERQAERLADRIGAAAYIECSASEQAKVKDVFDMAIVVGLDHRGLVKCEQVKRTGGLKIGRGLGSLKSASYGKVSNKESHLNEYVIEQKQRQQRHRWKRFLCCCAQ